MESVIDLGELNGPVLLFGGPYSNLAASQAMQLEARRLGIAPERLICTGDTVAYCAQPAETVELIRRWGIAVVMGNCEQSLAEGAPDCGCGFEADSACSLLSVGWYRYASQRISEPQRRWMAGLPRQIRFKLNGRRFLVVHGGVERINEFLFASSSAVQKQTQLAQAAADVVVGGHCGIPFGSALESGYWLNSGAIGMPANDGTPDGWYLLLTPQADRIEASWHRLSYEVAASYQAMLEAGLSNGYAEALQTGLWPSMDVLPEAEKCRAGQPLRLETLII
ncbi:metallophosphoesterase family protein [Marinobacterium arenosum]|uniref:metallophosphoesterase family protein n=1 Tax=Marinobacterium arenosum TaxID=2862496 RepID=UPI001C93FCC6|nr:metallophosphoesterase family protein [Marinobacterium arenosum]MBY4678476.1 metallophosphoesterase family protein [Marinobacterium arenosum]